MSTTRYHVEITHLDTSGNSYILYPKNTLTDVYTSPTSGVNINGKVMFFGTCSTAAATTAKTVIANGFSLVAGAHITVVFNNAITTTGATLNVSNTGAKSIYYEGVALKANVIRAGSRVELVYDGLYYHVIAGVNPAYVSKSTTKKFYLLGTPDDMSGTPGEEYYDSSVYVSTTSGELVASSFKGSGSNLTYLNASNITTGTLAKERLSRSGVTAGEYGSSTASPSLGGNFSIPKITVDEYGRVTNVTNSVITLPNVDVVDTKVTNTLNNTTLFYLTGTTSNKTNTGTQVFDTGVYVSTTAGQLVANSLSSPTLYFDGTSSYINKTKYTGQAASVATITSFIQDNVTGNGVNTKALSANQGYNLQSQITNLTTSKVESDGMVTGLYKENDGTYWLTDVDAGFDYQVITSNDVEHSLSDSYLPVSSRTVKNALDGKASSTHTHNYAGSNTAGGSALTVTVTGVTPTQSSNYNIPIVTPGIESQGVKTHNSLQVLMLSGSSSTKGYSILTLGNSVATGSNGNSTGRLRIFSDTNKYSDIYASGSQGENRSIFFPNADGTIALTKDLSSYLPLSGGNVSGDINIIRSTNDESHFTVKNSLREGKLVASTTGRVGIYDTTNSKWILYSESDGSAIKDGDGLSYCRAELNGTTLTITL